MDEKFTNPSPTLFQAGFWRFLPAFLGWTLLLLCGLALLVAGGVFDHLFRTLGASLVALGVLLTLLPPWLSSLIALLVPARRRILIDQTGYICRLGCETRRADWSTCGDVASAQPMDDLRSIQFTGKVSRGPLLWILLSVPSYLVLSAIGLILTLAISMMSDTSSAYYYALPGTDDPTRIPKVFLRGDAASALEAALRRHHAAAQAAVA